MKEDTKTGVIGRNTDLNNDSKEEKKTSKEENNNGSPTTAKHRQFTREPMREKPLTALAGIGEALGKKLVSKGYKTAWKVLGQFLILDKNRKKFEVWLKDVVGANTKQAGDCVQCLRLGFIIFFSERGIFCPDFT